MNFSHRAKPADSLFDGRSKTPKECRAYARRVLRDEADRFDGARQYETAAMLRFAADDFAAVDEIERQREQNTFLYDQWGLRVVACDKTEPHGWHGWVSANDDVRCPGVRA